MTFLKELVQACIDSKVYFNEHGYHPRQPVAVIELQDGVDMDYLYAMRAKYGGKIEPYRWRDKPTRWLLAYDDAPSVFKSMERELLKHIGRGGVTKKYEYLSKALYNYRCRMREQAKQCV